MANSRGIKPTYRKLRDQRRKSLLELAHANGTRNLESSIASQETEGKGKSQDFSKRRGSDVSTEGVLLLGGQGAGGAGSNYGSERRDPSSDHEERDRFWASEAMYPA